jgi:myo-inositol-1(or 4)-monophosphatase
MAPSDDDLLRLLRDAAAAVAAALGELDDWGLAGTRAGQHRSDLVADEAVLAALRPAGVGIVSEESGRHAATTITTDDGVAEVVVVVDPLDGSTNAHHRIPWYATSLCAVDAAGPRVAVVADLVRDRRYEAVRGGGATVDGRALRPSGCERLGDAVVGLSGLPPGHLGWSQFRALGAIALDLCAVAEGVLDGYVDCLPDAHGPWDHLGALLVCREAGAPVADASGRDLVVVDPAARRTPLAAATPRLLDDLAARRPSSTTWST